MNNKTLPATTTVINIKRDPTYDVYIGRNMRVSQPNILANRYAIGRDGSREDVIRKFAYDFRLRWKTEPEFRRAVLACRGKVLGCFCDDLCHGNVYIDFIEAFPKGEDAAFAAIEKYIHLPDSESDLLNQLS